MERENGGTMGLLAQQLEKVYGIGEEYYRGEVKRGLRNSDGTGVLIGVTKVGVRRFCRHCMLRRTPPK